MRIKTKLNVMTAIYLVFVVALVLILFLTSQQVILLEEEHRTSEELVQAIFELNILTDDYLMHFNERALQQWQTKYDSIENMLSLLGNKDPEKEDILNNIKEIHKSIEPIFANLKEPGISSELKNRLDSQLSIKSQSMVSEASRMAEIDYQEEVAIQQRARAITYIFIIIMSILIAATWLMITGISKPMNKLQKGTEIIGKGNLKYRIKIESKDELGELAKSFNIMTTNLNKAESHLNERMKELGIIYETSTIMTVFFSSRTLPGQK